jgi:hypothetical protein
MAVPGSTGRVGGITAVTGTGSHVESVAGGVPGLQMR